MNMNFKFATNFFPQLHTEFQFLDTIHFRTGLLKSNMILFDLVDEWHTEPTTLRNMFSLQGIHNLEPIELVVLNSYSSWAWSNNALKSGWLSNLILITNLLWSSSTYTTTIIVRMPFIHKWRQSPIWSTTHKIWWEWDPSSSGSSPHLFQVFKKELLFHHIHSSNN